MVKINEIPQATSRVDLSKLPAEAVLMAVREEVRADQPGKSGGLLIWFKDKDGNEFPQKYGRLAGARLAEALASLKIKDTTELQGHWFKYKLTAFRTGFPRYIPVERVKQS